MKLNKTELSKLIHNALSCEFDENERLRIKRFTKTQLKSYEAEDSLWLTRAKANATVTLDFISDSSFIALRFDLYQASSRPFAGFDLYVDGIFYEHRLFKNFDAKLLSFELPEGEHRITLYLPWSAETVINEVHISDGATLKEVKKNKKVLFLGDSITQGYVTEYSSLSYVARISGALDIEALNQGIGGYYFGKNSIDSSLAEYNPDIIVIAYGTNDYSRNDESEAFKKDAESYIEKLTSIFPKTKILAVLPIYRNDESNKTREKYRKYKLSDAREILKEIYGKYDNVRVISETGIPRIPDVFVEDFLHPNELGFAFMAESIGKEISKCLKD